MNTSTITKNYISELNEKTAFVRELSSVVKNHKNLKLTSIDFQVYKTKANDIYEFIVVNDGQAAKNCTKSSLKYILEIVYKMSNGGYLDEVQFYDIIKFGSDRIIDFNDLIK